MLKKFLPDPRWSFDIDDVKNGQVKFDDMVNIQICNVNYRLSAGWLALISHYEVMLPIQQCLNITFSETESRVINNVAGYLMVIQPPMEIQNGFYLIPGYTKYCINKTGEIRLIKTWNQVPEHLNVDGYPSVRIYDADKRGYRQIAIHILLAHTFIPNSDYVENPFVNHIDGDKTNYDLRNLEWVSALGNVLHALKTNLRTDNVPCYVRDVETGMITEHYSISEACRSIGYQQKQRIMTTFNGQAIPNLLRNRYELKLKDDPTPWYHQSKWTSRPTSCVQYQVYDIKTDTIHDCRTLSECTKLTGVDHSSIRSRLISKDNRLINGFAFREQCNLPWTRPTEHVIHHPARKIKVTDLDTGDYNIYPSINQVFLNTGIDKQTIRFRLRSGKPYKQFLLEEV